DHLDVRGCPPLDHADGECPLLGVAHLDRPVGRLNGELAVDGARRRVAANRVGLRLCGDYLAVRADQIEASPGRARVRAARDLFEFAEDGAALGQFLARVSLTVGRLSGLAGWPFAPEVDAVDVSVSEEHGAVVR